MEKESTDRLSLFTLAQLGELFPIHLQRYSRHWPRRYWAEQKRITKVMGRAIVRISHYGSTSVPGLTAKPTIDILLEVKHDTDISWLDEQCAHLGYLSSYQPHNPAPHRMYMKGYTAQGYQGQAYHLHVRYPGDWDELYFRDYLIDYPDVAKEYSILKLKLSECFRTNREAYTEAKTQFIRVHTLLARQKYGNRYAT
jgi:GrpB-like predicted nucleotidyltransferase (UPF0157 family)